MVERPPIDQGRLAHFGSWMNRALSMFVVVALWGPATAEAAGPASPRDRELPEGAKVRVAVEGGIEKLEEDYYGDLAGLLDWRLPVPKLLCDGGSGGEGDETEGTSGEKQGDKKEGERRSGDGSSCSTLFQMGVQLPFRVRIIDRPPDDPGLLRNEDWDELGDYLKAIRYVEYGEPDERVHGRVGELGAVSVGHGTIVNHYYNVVTPDHFRLGVHTNVNTVYGGGTLLVSDVTGPNVVGGRGYVRPSSFVDPSSWWRRFAVGGTLMIDPSAPVRLRRTEGEQLVTGPTQFPEVRERRAAAIAGLDAELAVVDSDLATLLPYVDVNYQFGLGSGLHGGVSGDLQPLEPLEVSAKLEFRSLAPRYLPDYFGPLYEIDRYQFPGWGLNLPQPKLQVAAEPRSRRRSGGYGELEAELKGWFDASVGYAEYQGPENGSVRFAAHVAPADRFRLGLFFYEHSLDDFDELFDGRESFIVAESRVGIVGPLYGKAAFSRLWRLNDDGSYGVVDRWNLGLGASISL